MAKKPHYLPGALLVPLVLFISTSLMAQVTHTTTGYGYPKIVNLKERTAYRQANPMDVPAYATVPQVAVARTLSPDSVNISPSPTLYFDASPTMAR